jgi:hypothetical protein
MAKLIEKIYTDPKHPAGYAGAHALYAAVKRTYPDIGWSEIRHFLEGSRTYTLFKPRRIHFPRLRTIPFGFLTGLYCGDDNIISLFI